MLLFVSASYFLEQLLPLSADVEAELGQPVSTSPNMFGGATDSYRYYPAQLPSAWRAAAYAFLDLVTLGGWELIAQPGLRRLAVEYDEQDDVVLVRKISEP